MTTVPPSHPLLDRARAQERVALTRLADVAGDTSLCTLSRSGTPRPSAKYHEGAVAALSEARRALAAAGSTPDALSAIRQAWQARRGSAVTATPAWSAYLDGAVDALDELMAAECVPATSAPFRAAPGLHLTTDLADDRAARRGASPHDAAASARASLEAAPTGAPASWTPAPARWTSLLAGTFPRRRLVALAVAAPALLAGLVAAGGGVAGATAGWLALVTAVAVTAAAVLATYVPLTGRRPHLGCTPCATVSGLSVMAAGILVAASAHAASGAMLALGVVLMGLVQRLTGAGNSCTR